MDTAIAELVGSDGATMYRATGGQAAGPTMSGQASVFAGASAGAGSNGTAIVLLIAVVGLTWFYIANKGMMR